MKTLSKLDEIRKAWATDDFDYIAQVVVAIVETENPTLEGDEIISWLSNRTNGTDVVKDIIKRNKETTTI